MPDLQTFATAVSKMRLAQKKYFARRSKKDMAQAIDAEAEVDRLLSLMAPQNVGIRADQAAQTQLFG